MASTGMLLTCLLHIHISSLTQHNEGGGMAARSRVATNTREVAMGEAGSEGFWFNRGHPGAVLAELLGLGLLLMIM